MLGLTESLTHQHEIPSNIAPDQETTLQKRNHGSECITMDMTMDHTLYHPETVGLIACWKNGMKAEVR